MRYQGRIRDKRRLNMRRSIMLAAQGQTRGQSFPNASRRTNQPWIPPTQCIPCHAADRLVMCLSRSSTSCCDETYPFSMVEYLLFLVDRLRECRSRYPRDRGLRRFGPGTARMREKALIQPPIVKDDVYAEGGRSAESSVIVA